MVLEESRVVVVVGTDEVHGVVDLGVGGIVVVVRMRMVGRDIIMVVEVEVGVGVDGVVVEAEEGMESSEVVVVEEMVGTASSEEGG
jgi:hypothetical protein